MKIGDKVRFLHETGGGVVAGFKGNQVLVEDEDGFQIPMLQQEVVVIEETEIKTHQTRAESRVIATAPTQEKEIITQKAAERQGGDRISFYLAFVPIDRNNFFHTDFELFLVNDSNYYIDYIYCGVENNNLQLRQRGQIEPNTQLFVEEITRDDFQNYERIAIQAMAYKTEKPFKAKPTIDVQLHIDNTKFFKLHSFQENLFFEQPALIYTIVENDKPNNPLKINAQALKESMYRGAETSPIPPRTTKRKGDENALIVDLHADALLNTTEGMQPLEILNLQIKKFKDILAENSKQKGLRIIFIHGKGEGVLRNAIINSLRHDHKKYTYQDASFQEYGYGATQVTIK